MIRIADKALHQQWAAYATWLRTHEREHLHRVLALIRNSARANATARWNGGQFEEACTERIITIYAGHLARAIAPTTPLPHPRTEPPLEQAPTRCAISAAITVLSPHELLTLTVCLESLANDADERRDTDWRRTKPGTARYWQCVSENARTFACEIRARTSFHELPTHAHSDTHAERQGERRSPEHTP